jgi:glycosyltransferase involved in cell wall biosynthesis
MKVAIVHDWLYTVGGAEKVLEQILNLFPQADLYTVVDYLPQKDRCFLKGRKVHTSFLQSVPVLRNYHRLLLPIMPLAVEQFDLSEYDLVISSHYAVAKGVVTGAEQIHVCYIHSPARYLWDMQHRYLEQANFGTKAASWLVRYMLHRLRNWDVRTSSAVDLFVANSHNVRRRVEKYYRRSAEVVYPPAYVQPLANPPERKDFYLTVSRLVSYKRVDLLVDAFAQLSGRELIVIGAGPELAALQRRAPGNVRFLGHLPTPEVHRYMAEARAFLFAAEEDFGIVPLEAQALGTPVIAYGRGGSMETVRDVTFPNPTGILFDEQTPESLIDAIGRFEKHASVFGAETCRLHASQFSAENFRNGFRHAIEARYRAFRADHTVPAGGPILHQNKVASPDAA